MVISHHASWQAARVAKECERLRSTLYRQWCVPGEEIIPDWTPRAMIVVHRSEGDYLREVGWRAGLTRGVCRVQVRDGQVVSRRIDLMADPDTGELTALAHELTHAILADCFPSRRLPRWADEGIALWADQPRKKGLHRQAVHRAIERQSAPAIADTLLRTDYPAGDKLPVFCGQSLMLVEFLVQLDEPSRVVEFTRVAVDHGYDRAAQQVYGLNGIADLQQRWLAHVRQSATRPVPIDYMRDPLQMPTPRKRT
ncbi:MAG: hypothetical protein MUF48_12935 [Pirellulaceae bacterium]|jgi:hypothetical protein|nr:hypothetical protein [Pirellulaceae bacterium]